MKQILNMKMFSMACLVMSIGLMTSCKKENDANSSQVVLLSFGPSGLEPGGQITFIGNNLDQVTSIELVGARVPKASFASQTSETIAIVAPLETEEGFITLKSPQGDIVSKTKLSFKVPVTIESITAEARPGDNITIKGNYVNWLTEVQFPKDLVVKEFVSKSLSEVVVTVPIEAQTGSLVFLTGGTKPLTIETDYDLVVTLPSITGMTPNPIAGGDILTITGTNLDLTMGLSFKGVTDPITEFVSQSATTITVVFPINANKGKIALIAHSGIKVESADALNLIGGLPELSPLAYAMYEDALVNNWQNWGWSSTEDFANTENVRDGSAAIKIDYTGVWGALKFANGSISTASYNEVTFSVFGGPGTNNKVINLTPSGGTTYAVTVKEGEWVEFKLTMADVGNPTTITDLVFQETGWAGTVYLDHVGLR